jgi:undecaprenyl-diphosphatase
MLRHRDDWPLLALAAACALLAWMFSTFGLVVLEGQLAGLDRTVRGVAMSNQSPAAASFFEAVAWLGSKSALIPIAVGAAWIVSRGNKMLVLWLLLASFISSQFVDLLKAGFGVTRPERGFAERESFSFPSGHVTAATSIAVMLCYVSFRRRAAKIPVLIACVVITLLMGVSRIYLDMHWFSDVLGGYLVGAMIGLAFCFLYEWAERRARKTTTNTLTNRGEFNESVE